MQDDVIRPGGDAEKSSWLAGNRRRGGQRTFSGGSKWLVFSLDVLLGSRKKRSVGKSIN